MGYLSLYGNCGIFSLWHFKIKQHISNPKNLANIFFYFYYTILLLSERGLTNQSLVMGPVAW